METRRLLVAALGATALFATACDPGPASPGPGTGPGETTTTTASLVDADGDGYHSGVDCNDGDASINPGAADAAGDDIDQNCDGVDGERNDAVFVNAGTGADTSGCGTITEPCASIGQGQTRALAEGKTKVFVAGGTYAKFGVVAGLEVRGGYG
ncbi:MAG: hypothetical protein GX868_11530, partial [Actinobacteria bacterium]|nr:hypothetical protein [Actinomycetota bacterium]